MANGLVEKWNGTLQRMLAGMRSERPRDWDRHLEPLMFAYREASQENTKCSPYELLYARTVRGPMTILRELWVNDTPDEERVQTYEYILDLRNRIGQTCELARDNLRDAQGKHKVHFDQKESQS